MKYVKIESTIMIHQLNFLWSYVKDKAFVPPWLNGIKTVYYHGYHLGGLANIGAVWAKLNYGLGICYVMKDRYTQNL